MVAPTAPAEPFPWKEADKMLTLLINRAAQLSHCRAGSQEDEEFDCLANAIEAYEAKRWPASPRSSGASSVALGTSSVAATNFGGALRLPHAKIGQSGEGALVVGDR